MNNITFIYPYTVFILSLLPQPPTFSHSLDEVHGWGYQDCLPHQAAVVDAAAVLAGISSSQDTSMDSGWLIDQGWTETERTAIREMMQLLDSCQVENPTRKQAILQELMNQQKNKSLPSFR